MDSDNPMPETNVQILKIETTEHNQPADKPSVIQKAPSDVIRSSSRNSNLQNQFLNIATMKQAQAGEKTGSKEEKPVRTHQLTSRNSTSK
jgi:hypothetical protein